MSARSLAIIETGRGVSVTTGFATGEETSAWTTQRAVYNYWVNCRFCPWSPSWTPAADSGGVPFDAEPIPIFFKTRRSTWTRSFQVRCAVMSFVLIVSVGWSKHLPLISSLASNRYEC